MMPIRINCLYVVISVFAVISLPGTVAPPSCAFGADNAKGPGSAEVDSDTARYYLSGMWAAIDACRRGEVKISDMGTVIFDDDQSAIRYDCNQPSEWGGSSHVVITPLQMIEYIPGRGGITKYFPDHRPASQVSVPPDIGLIGLLTISEWKYRYPRAQYLTEVDAQFSLAAENKAEVVLVATAQISPSGDSQIVAELTRRLVLDRKQQLVPIRVDVTVQCDATKRSMKSSSITQWSAIENVMVPVRCEQAIFETLDGVVKKDDKFDFELTWKHVNGQIVADAFEPAGLGAPRRTLVVDYRHSPPLEEKLGVQAVVNLEDNKANGSFRKALIGINCLFVAIVVGILAYRKWNVNRR